jgi:hypothetical protein
VCIKKDHIEAADSGQMDKSRKKTNGRKEFRSRTQNRQESETASLSLTACLAFLVTWPKIYNGQPTLTKL